MPKKKKETSFENDLERLEELVNKMESGDATLEQSLVWFEQGMDLIRSCQDQLTNAEQKVQELIQNTNGEIDTKDVNERTNNIWHLGQY